MSVTRQRRIRRLFVEALDAPDREAFLAALGAATREEVEALLRAEASMGDFMDESALVRLRRPLPEGTAVGAYTVVRVLGVGGTGTVYEAIQAQPRRRVALKVMHAPRTAVHAEAEILARLKHPGIAHVYEAGEHDGLPWFALEYVEGAGSVREHARELAPRARLELVARVCDAVHHGHQKGVIHRDLKPGNVLVDEVGFPKVIDFGIARSTGEPGRAGIAGTPPYMAPEQFADHADVRSDVYALGVLLYEVLAGRLPFDVSEATLSEATRIIREEAPAPLGRAWRGDVEAIVSKAIARDPEARYASAAALAADIRRHLGHWPVEARRAGLAYQLGKFARRQRAAFAALAGVVAVSIAGALVAGRLALEREHARKAAEYQAYLGSVAAASAALRLGDVAEARINLDRAPVALRGWEWHHLRGRLDMSARRWPGLGRVQAGAVGPGGRVVAAASRDSLVRVWEAASGRLLHELAAGNVEAMAFRPDGRDLVLGSFRGPVEIRNARTGELRTSIPDAHRGNVTMVAFAPDGGSFATSSYDGAVKLWDADSGRCLRVLRPHEGRVLSVVFDPGGAWLATGGAEADPTIRVTDLATGNMVRVLEGHQSNVEGLAASPDGRRLASVSMDHTVRLWDTATWRLLAVRKEHTAGVKDVAFGPDGLSFATASMDRTVRLWSAEGAEEIACLKGHGDHVYGVAYVGTRELASFSMDGTVRFWSAGSDEVPTLRVRPPGLGQLEFAPDGRRLLSASLDGAIQLWDPGARREVAAAQVAPGETRVIADGDARAFAARSATATCTLFLGDGDAPPGFVPLRAVRAGGKIFASPDGRAVEAYEGAARVARWDRGPVRHLVADPAGRLVAAAGGGAVDVWDAASLAHLSRAGLEEAATVLALAPVADRMAVVTAKGVSLRSWRTGERVLELARGTPRFGAVAFSPDGARLAGGGADGTIRVWDPDTGAALLVLQGHSIFTSFLAWSPDGRRLASGGGGWHPEGVTIRLWEASGGG